MNKETIAKIIGVLFALLGLICILICIFKEGKSTRFLSIGLACNSIAFIIYCIVYRRNKSIK